MCANLTALNTAASKLRQGTEHPRKRRSLCESSSRYFASERAGLCYIFQAHTAVHRRTLTRSPTLPTFQVAKDFALPAATASFSLRFTVPQLAAEHFRLPARGCGTACHWRLRRHRLGQPSALDSRHFCSLNHILTFGSSDTFCVYTLSIVDLAVF